MKTSTALHIKQLLEVLKFYGIYFFMGMAIANAFKITDIFYHEPPPCEVIFISTEDK